MRFLLASTRCIALECRRQCGVICGKMNPPQYLLCGYILLARKKHRCESTFPLRICKQLVIAAFWYIKMVLTNVLAQYLCTRFAFDVVILIR